MDLLNLGTDVESNYYPQIAVARRQIWNFLPIFLVFCLDFHRKVLYWESEFIDYNIVDGCECLFEIIGINIS